MRVLRVLRLLVLFVGVLFVPIGQAETVHWHPSVVQKGEQRVRNPGYCEIELINRSREDVRVSGVYPDGTYLYPFYLYRNDYPEYISLEEYNGFCYSGMRLTIESVYGYLIYSGYVERGSTVWVIPRGNRLQAEVRRSETIVDIN